MSLPSGNNQIPLSRYQELRYGKLFTDQLKNSPAENKQDFQVITSALKALSDHSALPSELRSRPMLADKVQSLQEICDDPGL